MFQYWHWRALKFVSRLNATLRYKSGVGIIVDYSRDYTVVNGV